MLKTQFYKILVILVKYWFLEIAILVRFNQYLTDTLDIF